MREKIKESFDWDDRNDKETFCPCKYCEAVDKYPVCDDGATTSACNHCDYNIIQYCLTHNV